MAHHYPQQTFGVHAHSGWDEDVKGPFDGESSHLVGDRTYHDNMSDTMPGSAHSRRQSVVKLEEELSAAQMWYGRPQSSMAHMRHSTIPDMNISSERMTRILSQSYGVPYGPTPSWPTNPDSGSSTPTLMHGPVVETMPLSFNSTTGTYPFQHEHNRSIAMSPQSSQGGWASAHSDDSARKCDDTNSPKFRAMAGMMVQRSDGVRKKNARFDIPSHVNLDNVEELILNETNEEVRKELKQQKRLLRNRQAALESRSRKRDEMAGLQKEKKKWLEEQKDLIDELARLKNVLDHEREQMMQQRQQYDLYIQGLTYERDEAIRSRTLETAELRRQNNVLKDIVRDMERHQAGRGFDQHTTGLDTYGNDFPSFGSLDLADDGWEDEFSLINSDDLKMDGEDSPQRQLTPRPLPVSLPTSATDPSSSKTDQGFSWNTFYMCLLFGAFIASQPNPPSSNSAAPITTDQPISSLSLPSLSDEHRAEASNVLKAVLASDGDGATDTAPSSLLTSAQIGHDHSLPLMPPPAGPASSLDILSTHLTTPTRQQQVAAAFALTPAHYEHITNPEGLPLSHASSVSEHRRHAASSRTGTVAADFVPKPSPLQAMFASMQAERDEVERAIGLGSKSRERSAILDRVPEKVLQDFRRLVAEREGRAAAGE